MCAAVLNLATMISDARRLEDDFKIECDLCIVGTGAAGLTLAHFLKDTSLSICLIESGGMIAEPETQDLYRGESTGNVDALSPSYLLDSRLRFFGGTTNHWGGHCRPLEAIDFEARPWVPHSGWPFPKTHLDPYYDIAAEFMGLPLFRADNPDAGDSRFPASLDSELVVGRVYRLRAKRFAIDHKEEIAESRNIQLVNYANALEIVTLESNKAVQSLRVGTLGGTRGSIKARSYVLAAGAVENSRLLLASNTRRRGGVGNEHDLVGRYFMEHPVTQFGMGPLAVWPEVSVELYSLHADLRQQVLYPRDAIMRERKMLTTTLMVQPAVPTTDGLLAAIARGKQAEHIYPLDAFDHALTSAAYDSDHLDIPTKPIESPQHIHTMFICEQEPNPESRVTLSDQRDALGMPRAKLSWNLTGAETRSIFEMAELVGRSIAKIGAGRLRVRIPMDELQDVFYQGFHHMGTTRMHVDPKRGVVDPDGRVHGIANLYVAGSSLFPTCGAANPTYTIVALAIRMADHLQQDLRAA